MLQKKVIDILMTAWDIWAVTGIIGTITGVGVISYRLLVATKALAKKYAAEVAAGW